jgi:hypothetical protein
MKERRSIPYSFEDIKRYRQGLMSPEEMHAFESASMEDPFLADALEGYMQSDIPTAERHLSNITERVTNKESEREKAVVVSMPRQRFQMWRVAAMVIIVIGAGLITYNILDKKNIEPASGPIAQVEQKTPTATQPVPAITDTITGTVNATPEVVDQQHTSKSTAKNSRADALTAAREKNEEKNDIARSETTRDDEVRREEKYSRDVVRVPVENKPAAAAPNLSGNEIRGTIVTPLNEPLANTNLRIDNTKKEVKTDGAGNFVVTSKDSVVNAVVTSGNFVNSQVQLRANSTSIINIGTIKLKADPNMKLDIEVIGLGARKRSKDTVNIKPEGGWVSFKEHIAKWLSDPADTSAWDNTQEFEMEFYVDSKGFAKDVKILNGINPVIAEQIKEAIVNGPKWVSRNQKTRLLFRF